MSDLRGGGSAVFSQGETLKAMGSPQMKHLPSSAVNGHWSLVIESDEGQMTLLDTGLANDADLYFINSRHKLRFPSTYENLFSSLPSTTSP